MRDLPPAAYAGDVGDADPALAAALAAADVEAVVAALPGARLLVPVVATASEDGDADMALVTLRGRDGRSALPVFSHLAALSAWDAAARPVPVEARRAALSAVDEGADVLVVDPAGAAVVVPRPAVWALARGVPWTPSPRDPEVLAAVRAACRAVPGVRDAEGEPGERAELRVVLSVVPGLDRPALDALTADAGRRLAAEQLVADRVDSLELRLLPAPA